MSRKIRLLIADDHAIMREGLKQMFVFAQDLQVVAEAEDGVMVLEKLHRNDIDLVLLDVNMPGLSGVDMISRIHARYPDQKILVLSMHDEPHIALHAISVGATGYLCKVCSFETLLSAIRCVASGTRFLDPQIAENIALDTCGLKQRIHHDSLSERELQVLRLLAGGVKVSRIATMLTISSKTVSTHKSRLMEKMKFSTNAQIVRYALGQQLIE